jgi:Zn-dependent M28 family amino/carboxypeptidase
MKAAGVIGVVTLPNPSNMDIPWSRMALNRAHPSMALAAPEFDHTAGEKFGAYFNPAHADKLFAGSGHTFEELLQLAKEKEPLPHFPLAVSIRSKASVQQRELTSNNIVAKLTGSDPKLKNEYVVLSAHIDHLGIGAPINGDKIYNGAMDNGSGSAALLDIAKSIAGSGDKPKRSILFLWVTGEEKGLLGSEYFAAHPTVTKSDIVADVNMDMFLPIIPLKTMTVFGLAESDLGDWAREACESQGVSVQPDPEPERNAFIRSDQYSFIKQGVPAVAMDVGFTKDTFPIQKQWLTNRYHAPSDDLNQPVDKQAAAKYEEIARTLLLKTADAPSKPEWKQESFFKRFAKGQ